ncbi:MAG: adenine phosphoribosyltransferase [Actinobacteria bacterium]|nr:adenine phosphoribosyltransferase [Actinomycetota bacterium]
MQIDLPQLIRSVPDFPKPGIIFRDITPLLADPVGLDQSVAQLSEPYRDRQVDLVAAIEARGFIFGAAVARQLGAGFVPIRKPGKLPAATTKVSYQLEYGSDSIEIHTDAISPGRRVLLIDDLLATGGTMAAACKLVTSLGAEIVALAFVIELSFLNGREKLAGHDILSLITYDAE